MMNKEVFNFFQHISEILKSLFNTKSLYVHDKNFSEQSSFSDIFNLIFELIIFSYFIL